MSAFQEVARTTAIFCLWFIVVPVAIATIHIIINYYKKQKGRKTMWQKILDLIRNAETPIETSESGIPQIAVNAPVSELFQLLAALAAGYNRNVRRIKALRELARKPFDHADEDRLPEEKKEEARNTYKWVLCSERLPKESGEYYTFGSGMGVYPLGYSAKHKLWNTRDCKTRDEALETAIFEITHWREKPEAPMLTETED